MYSWLVTVLFLASAAYSSGGARVPITSYICTQPNRPGFRDLSQCSVSSGLRTCETKEGGSPTLLDGDSVRANGWYGWNNNTNPFVVLDIPQGWWVGSVGMTFLTRIPALSISVHSSERLSTNTDRTVFSNVSEAGSTPVVVNFTTLACGRYLRINMTEDQYFFLAEIEVFGTNDPICTPPSSASTDKDNSICTCTPPSSAGADTGYEVPPTPVSTPPGTITTRENSLTHLMPTSVPRDSRTHNGGSTDMGCSAGVSSAVFFAGLLAGAALAGPVGALSVVCYHWKKKQARTRGKDSTMTEDREMAYDYPLQLETNPAYKVVWK